MKCSRNSETSMSHAYHWLSLKKTFTNDTRSLRCLRRFSALWPTKTLLKWTSLSINLTKTFSKKPLAAFTEFWDSTISKSSTNKSWFSWHKCMQVLCHHLALTAYLVKQAFQTRTNQEKPPTSLGTCFLLLQNKLKLRFYIDLNRVFQLPLQETQRKFRAFLEP